MTKGRQTDGDGRRREEEKGRGGSTLLDTVADGDRTEKDSHLGTVQRSKRKRGEAESKRADECVRKPLSRFRQLEKIDHRNPQRGSSQVTAAVFIYTADNK